MAARLSRRLSSLGDVSSDDKFEPLKNVDYLTEQSSRFYVRTSFGLTQNNQRLVEFHSIDCFKHFVTPAKPPDLLSTRRLPTHRGWARLPTTISGRFLPRLR